MLTIIPSNSDTFSFVFFSFKLHLPKSQSLMFTGCILLYSYVHFPARVSAHFIPVSLNIQAMNICTFLSCTLFETLSYNLGIPILLVPVRNRANSLWWSWNHGKLISASFASRVCWMWSRIDQSDFTQLRLWTGVSNSKMQGPCKLHSGGREGQQQQKHYVSRDIGSADQGGALGLVPWWTSMSLGGQCHSSSSSVSIGIIWGMLVAWT